MDVLTRKEAAKRGLHRYYTGQKCVNGHLTLRYTAGGACVACRAHHARNASTILNKTRGALSQGLRHLEFDLPPVIAEQVIRYAKSLELAYELSK